MVTVRPKDSCKMNVLIVVAALAAFSVSQASGFLLPPPPIVSGLQLYALNKFDNFVKNACAWGGIKPYSPAALGLGQDEYVPPVASCYGNLGQAITDTAALSLALEAKTLSLENQAILKDLSNNAALSTTQADIASPVVPPTDTAVPAATDPYLFDKLLGYC